MVFPFTYNLETGLLKEVTESMDATGISYRILTDYLTDEQMAFLRIVSDVMISVPSSDQMTASMLEVLYAGGIVITGKWLPYALLDENGVAYYRIGAHEELAPLLTHVIRSMTLGQPLLETGRNRQIIGNLFDRRSTIQDWIALYRE